MSFENELYQHLTTFPNLEGVKVYAVNAPNGIKPKYIVYEQVSGGRQYTHDGYAGLKRPRVQISCYAKTYEDAKDLATKVTVAMENWVYTVFQSGESDAFEENTGLYNVPVDFLIWYEGE